MALIHNMPSRVHDHREIDRRTEMNELELSPIMPSIRAFLKVFELS